MNIRIQYSEDSIFGDRDPADDNLNVAATLDNFEEGLYAAIKEAYPDAEVEIERSINDSITVDSQADVPEVNTIHDIMDKVWSSFDYDVFN